MYTSGKGSSAAGLTASVNRDPVTVSTIVYFACVDIEQPQLFTLEELYNGRWCHGAGRWRSGLH